MIAPDIDLDADARVSLPVGVVNTVYAVLSELPARQVMDLLLAVRQQAEVITRPEDDEDPGEVSS